MRWYRMLLMFAVLCPSSAFAQGSYQLEVLKEAPPSALASPIKEALSKTGYRIIDDQGKTYAEFWLRQSVPASSKPSGPMGAVLFPFLAEGELLGAIRFAGEGHDYRDQTISKGVYTLRYGLQPMNGDHLGVSTYRDYALLSPSSKDQALADIPRKKLEEQSAEAAGTSHPAVLMMLAAPDPTKTDPTVTHDEAKNTWGAGLPLNLTVKGQAAALPFPVQIVVIGAAMS